MTNYEVERIRENKLILKQPFHNQPSIECHVKLVTEASTAVAGFERRDGLIDQKIKSRKLKSFETKKQFNV